MYPPPKNTILNTNARHTAGRFAYYHYPKDIQQKLTKVNKQGIRYSEPASSRAAILLMVKPASISVNKINRIFSSPGPAPHFSEPEQIIQYQHTQPRGKQHYRVWSPVLLIKFAYHPYTIGQYPQHYGYIMKELRFAPARAPQQVYGHAQGRGYHYHAANFELQRPTSVFYQPQQYMAVFQHTVAWRLVQLSSSLVHARKIKRKTDIMLPPGSYYCIVNIIHFSHALWILSPRPVPLPHVLITHIK